MINVCKPGGLQMATRAGNGGVAGQYRVVKQLSAQLKTSGGDRIFGEIIDWFWPAWRYDE